MIRHLSIIVVTFVILSTVPALAQSDTAKVEDKQLHALTGLLQVPSALSDQELAAIEGQFANFHALPNVNPGTAVASGFPPPVGDGAIPSNVFLTIVMPRWFGAAAGN
jgi:hypothetical protein